ncbi:amidohydrolase family protein [Mitsuokella sp. oral taxon 131]|uniref:amidohydrolase family protein n=1 Tax=Mitsuokella sp. oral taxon 131 TaxID=1321780 RepID=UPI0003FD4973|nr:amidohydrolase family protein [Mitsuokella sp. oral taxon 131]
MLKIIDAHLHVGEDPYFDEIAQAANHENNMQHLEEQYRTHGIVHGVVMGNLPVSNTHPQYASFHSYCVGLDSRLYGLDDIQESLPYIEQHFNNPNCVGAKLYPGYSYFYISDDRLAPLYKLAASYKKPVAVHTGLTATDSALLKYSHPMVMDEAATKFRDVQFVMCHLGEPWFSDAIAVMEKNPNVAADLSGMLEGKISDFGSFLKKKRFYIEMLKGWLAYLDCYERFLFGTDWPLANLGDYIAFIKHVIPQEEWENVFYRNAIRIYGLNPAIFLVKPNV